MYHPGAGGRWREYGLGALDVKAALELTFGFFPVDSPDILSVYIVNLMEYLNTIYTLS